MHIPDGFLDARTCVATFCLAGAGLAWAERKSSARQDDGVVPLLGVMSAFVFAGQMVNFPVAGGTSGHLLGAALASVVLGPSAAVLALATVVIAQSLLFQDGGITALGANLFNIAIAAPLSAWACYSLVRKAFPNRTGLAAGIASWGSVIVAAMLCSIELASSGNSRFGLVAPAMLVTHAVTGVVEGIITCTIVSVVFKVRPELASDVARATSARISLRRGFGMGCAVAIGALLLLAPWASTLPDGLEAVAERLGFASKETQAHTAPAAGYLITSLPDRSASTVVAGAIGVVACVGVWIGWGRWCRHRAASGGGR